MTSNQAKKFLQRIREHVEKAEEIYIAASRMFSDFDADQFSDFVGWDLENSIQCLISEIEDAETAIAKAEGR